MQEPNYIYFETYGCAANQNNTEIMKGLVKQAGLSITNNKDIADIIILNTCIVKGPTENKIERRIQDLKRTDKPIIIAGCMPGVRREKLQYKNIFLLGINNVNDINKLIMTIYQDKYNEELFMSEKNEEKICQPKISQNKNIGIIQIAQGCNGNCSYCITKLVKKNLFSYSQEKILKAVKNDLNNCKEIWITSQDNAAYGLDRRKRELPILLEKILNLDRKYRVRLGMMNPNNVLPILDQLIEKYKNKKLYNFLHIPLQSGSNKILEKMNRKYTREDFLKIINKFKQEIPGIAISTDVIVGYPGENEEDFKETLEIIKKIKPDILNVSRYWEKKETLASKEKQVPFNIRKERAKKTIDLFRNISKNKKKKEIGNEYEVLVNGKKEGIYLARNDNYGLIKINNGDNLTGKFLRIKVTGRKGYHLKGKIIEY